MNLARIIAVDNYNSETVADQHILYCNPETAEKVVEILNNDPYRGDQVWYKVVEWDYKLWRGMEELI